MHLYYKVQWTPLMATTGRAKMGIISVACITLGFYLVKNHFRRDRINRLDIIPVALLSGIYCSVLVTQENIVNQLLNLSLYHNYITTLITCWALQPKSAEHFTTKGHFSVSVPESRIFALDPRTHRYYNRVQGDVKTG